MSVELHQLMTRVAELRDEDLLRMVHSDSNQYRPEALTYARAEITEASPGTETCGCPGDRTFSR